MSGKVAKAQPISNLHPAAKVEELIASPWVEDLLVAARDVSLSEDLALTILRRRDLNAAVLEAMARNPALLKHRKVVVHVVEHHRSPRHVSLPLLRRLFPFELMHVALAPAVSADVRLVAEELLTGKLGTLSLGERITLGRQASPKVAGALLLHAERAVIETALQNPRMTEASIVKSLASSETPLLLLNMLLEHPKWSLRREIQIGILRRPEATDALVSATAAKLPKAAIYDLLMQLNLPVHRKQLLQRALLQL